MGTNVIYNSMFPPFFWHTYIFLNIKVSLRQNKCNRWPILGIGAKIIWTKLWWLFFIPCVNLRIIMCINIDCPYILGLVPIFSWCNKLQFLSVRCTFSQVLEPQPHWKSQASLKPQLPINSPILLFAVVLMWAELVYRSRCIPLTHKG